MRVSVQRFQAHHVPGPQDRRILPQSTSAQRPSLVLQLFKLAVDGDVFCTFKADAVASVGPAEEAGGQSAKKPEEVEKEARARHVVSSPQREASASDSPLMANEDSLAQYSCEVQNLGRCCT
ncbi:unnamed protein product [Boreogadus saida]